VISITVLTSGTLEGYAKNRANMCILKCEHQSLLKIVSTADRQR